MESATRNYSLWCLKILFFLSTSVTFTNAVRQSVRSHNGLFFLAWKPLVNFLLANLLAANFKKIITIFAHKLYTSKIHIQLLCSKDTRDLKACLDFSYLLLNRVTIQEVVNFDFCFSAQTIQPSEVRTILLTERSHCRKPNFFLISMSLKTNDQKWYFVTKIVLTYREKKIALVIKKNF